MENNVISYLAFWHSGWRAKRLRTHRSHTMYPILLVVGLLAGPVALADEALVMAYWTNATPPFALREGDKLTGGIIRDLGDELAGRMNVDIRYQLLPTKRIERQLQAGTVHLDCVTSPIWKEAPDKLGWSPLLFHGADRFLVNRDKALHIKSFTDLEGLSVGVYSDYVYHPAIMALFESGKTKRIDLNDIDHGIKLLLANRIDTMIDFGVLLSYQLDRQNLSGKLRLAEKHADDFELRCAYSPKLADKQVIIDKHLQEMVDDGAVARILADYR